MLPEALLEADADVVCLQEVYERRHQDFLMKKVGHLYPYSFFTHKKTSLFDSGLAILSKHPFTFLEEVVFKTLGFEKISRKGALLIQFTEGQLKDLVLANCHFPYGGYGSKSKVSDIIMKIRDIEVDRLVEHLKKYTDRSLVCGDFNFGPNIAKANFDNLSQYFDNIGNGYVTWHNDNPLNRMFPLSKPQSIDHIMASKVFSKEVISHVHERLFDEIRKLNGKHESYLSDHYAVAVRVVL